MLRDITSTLYERLGGEQAITAVVNDFYDRMLADNRVNHHFIGTNMESLRQHQITFFMSYALGGPLSYDGASLRQLRADLNITSEEYEISIKHLNSALRKYKVPIENMAKIEAFIRMIKPHIVKK